MTRLFRYLMGLRLRAVLVLICGPTSVLFLLRSAEVARTQGEKGGAPMTTILWQAIVRTPMELQNALPHVIIVSARLHCNGPCPASKSP